MRNGQTQRMTLIVTLFSDLGIVQTSDSNLTYGSGLHAGTGTKLFRVPGHDAVLAFAGCYAIGGRSVEDWMPDALRLCAQHASLAEVAAALRDQIQTEARFDEASAGYLMQLAGYELRDGARHPVLWFIRNLHHIHDDGSYSSGQPDFLLSEDLWNRDRLRGAGGLFVYANGTPEGRINFMAISQLLLAFLAREVWSRGDWAFHPPATVAQLGQLANFLVKAITMLFEMSSYKGPPIGGDIQQELLAAPVGTLSLRP